MHLSKSKKIIKTHGSSSSKNGQNISDFTSPLKMFEYMAHKKVIIASDLPVLREVLNSKNSILVHSEKPDEWVRSLENMKDPQKRAGLQENALADFQNFRWVERAKNVIK